RFRLLPLLLWRLVLALLRLRWQRQQRNACRRQHPFPELDPPLHFTLRLSPIHISHYTWGFACPPSSACTGWGSSVSTSKFESTSRFSSTGMSSCAICGAGLGRVPTQTVASRSIAAAIATRRAGNH